MGTTRDDECQHGFWARCDPCQWFKGRDINTYSQEEVEALGPLQQKHYYAIFRGPAGEEPNDATALSDGEKAAMHEKMAAVAKDIREGSSPVTARERALAGLGIDAACRAIREMHADGFVIASISVGDVTIELAKAPPVEQPVERSAPGGFVVSRETEPQPLLDEDGNQLFDENGRPMTEKDADELTDLDEYARELGIPLPSNAERDVRARQKAEARRAKEAQQ